MPIDIRYVGTSTWERVITKDDGSYDRTERVEPGETVSVSEEIAERLAGTSTPRYLRNFVLAGSSEDPQSKEYQPSRREVIPENNNATPFPEADMGSPNRPEPVSS